MAYVLISALPHG